MKTGFAVSADSQWPLDKRPGSPSRKVAWISYGAMLPLLLASAPIAQAAPMENSPWLGLNSPNLAKSEDRKTPKASPTEVPLLNLENLGPLQVQSMAVEIASTPDETTLLETEPVATEAAELMPQSSDPLLPTSSANPASLAESPTLTAQATDGAGAIPWRFSVEPYFYLPFGASGDITVRGITAPIDAGIGDIFNSIVNDLNFAAFGRLEAWNGPWGILFDGTYMNVGTGQTAVINLPPNPPEGLPPQVAITSAVGSSYTKLDLAGGYRFGDGNLPNAFRTANTEFDLGPFVFDAIAGLRLYFFNNDLVLTSDLGQRFAFSQSRTIAEPMIGGRARWNLSDNLAVLTGASLSGFGIGDLTFSADGYAGIDWLFSGNTSLMASYRLTYVNYSGGDSGLNLFTHGPMMGVKFRF